MIKLVLCKHKSDYTEDVARIVSVCTAKGYEIDEVVAEQAWLNYSDSMAVGWLNLPENDRVVFHTILCWTEEAVEHDDERAG